MRDHRVDLDLAGHVHVDDLGHVGAALGTAERRAAPVASGDELERTRRDFLARLGDTDDDRRAPAAMARLERGAHHFGVAGGVEGIVRAAIGDRDDCRDHFLAAQPLGVEEVGHAEPAAPFLAIGVDVDADDLVGPGEARALDHVEPDATEPEDDDIVADLNLGGVDHRADTRRHAAADVAARLERRVLADLRDRNLGQDGEVREGRAAHVMEDRLPLVREARCAVGHQALSLRRADRGAEVGLPAEARLTLAAFGRVERDDVIAGLHTGHASADFADDPGTLMPQHAREQPLRIQAVERVGVGMANPGRHDFDQHFARLWPLQIEFDDLQRLLRFERYGGTGLHGRILDGGCAPLTGHAAPVNALPGSGVMPPAHDTPPPRIRRTVCAPKCAPSGQAG